MTTRKVKTSVHFVGGNDLVLELGKLCVDAGMAVTAQVQPRTGKQLIKPMKASVTAPRAVACGFELTLADKKLKLRNLIALERQLPKTTLILSSSVAITVGEQATWMRNPERLIGVCAMPTLLSRPLTELAPSSVTSSESVRGAQAFFLALGKEIAVVQDRVGMVLPRILCMLINEAAFALTDNVASATDIDTAMKLGTNYPLGPIEWAAQLGIDNVVSVLDALHADSHEERYRAAPLLRQLAYRGISRSS